MIEERRRSVGSFEVGRVLPFAKRRMVGPFIFLDHIGPVELPKRVSRDTDVRPHPHIGLTTVTYLFTGEITHRDSTGVEQAIRPGEMNWMIAGRGITHSERFERARREGGRSMASSPGLRCRSATRRPSRLSPTMRVQTYVNPKAKKPDQVAILTREGCSFCAGAKKLLKELGYDYAEVSLPNTNRSRIVGAITGKGTVPQIFVNGRHIGGLEDLQSWTKKAA